MQQVVGGGPPAGHRDVFRPGFVRRDLLLRPEVTVHGATVISERSEGSRSEVRSTRSFAALRMTGTLPGCEQLQAGKATVTSRWAVVHHHRYNCEAGRLAARVFAHGTQRRLHGPQAAPLHEAHKYKRGGPVVENIARFIAIVSSAVVLARSACSVVCQLSHDNLRSLS